MISELRKYPSHYLALSIILAVGSITILLFRFDALLLNIAVYSMGGMYIVWGILHHRSANHIRLKVMLEYLLVALLGIIIIKTLV